MRSNRDLDFSSIVEGLSAISSVAVIAGAFFIVFQLRQNASLIEATNRENRASTSIALLEKITNESFARRRKAMYDTVKKYAGADWKGFDDTLEDFEARNFGYTYELIGQLVRDGLIEMSVARNALHYIVVLDWDTFKPMAEHLVERYKVNTWTNFEWLAEDTRRNYKAPRSQYE
jgi:hypothetical protein